MFTNMAFNTRYTISPSSTERQIAVGANNPFLVDNQFRTLLGLVVLFHVQELVNIVKKQ